MPAIPKQTRESNMDCKQWTDPADFRSPELRYFIFAGLRIPSKYAAGCLNRTRPVGRQATKKAAANYSDQKSYELEDFGLVVENQFATVLVFGDA